MSGDALTPLRVVDAFAWRADGYEGPIPIRGGRCEKMLGSTAKYGVGPDYCGKPGRWLVGHEFRCGEHKDAS